MSHTQCSPDPILSSMDGDPLCSIVASDGLGSAEDWVALYLKACQEPDLSRLEARVTTAEQAISRRMKSLRPGFASDATEFFKLQAALAELRSLTASVGAAGKSS